MVGWFDSWIVWQFGDLAVLPQHCRTIELSNHQTSFPVSLERRNALPPTGRGTVLGARKQWNFLLPPGRARLRPGRCRRHVVWRNDPDRNGRGRPPGGPLRDEHFSALKAMKTAARTRKAWRGIFEGQKESGQPPRCPRMPERFAPAGEGQRPRCPPFSQPTSAPGREGPAPSGPPSSTPALSSLPVAGPDRRAGRFRPDNSRPPQFRRPFGACFREHRTGGCASLAPGCIPSPLRGWIGVQKLPPGRPRLRPVRAASPGGMARTGMAGAARRAARCFPPEPGQGNIERAESRKELLLLPPRGVLESRGFREFSPPSRIPKRHEAKAVLRTRLAAQGAKKSRGGHSTRPGRKPDGLNEGKKEDFGKKSGILGDSGGSAKGTDPVILLVPPWNPGREMSRIFDPTSPYLSGIRDRPRSFPVNFPFQEGNEFLLKGFVSSERPAPYLRAQEFSASRADVRRRREGSLAENADAPARH